MGWFGGELSCFVLSCSSCKQRRVQIVSGVRRGKSRGMRPTLGRDFNPNLYACCSLRTEGARCYPDRRGRNKFEFGVPAGSYEVNKCAYSSFSVC